MASHSDVASAEKRCVSMVVNGGKKLKFALLQAGLNYKSNTPQYHRIRRKVCKEKEKKKQRTGIYYACHNVCDVLLAYIFIFIDRLLVVSRLIYFY